MSYLYLVMSGILFGGVVFGAKVLYLMGASLFEVLFYPNLISVLLVWGFARRDFVKIFKMPWPFMCFPLPPSFSDRRRRCFLTCR